MFLATDSRPAPEALFAKLVVSIAVLCLGVLPTLGHAQGGKGTLVTVVRSEGYSHTGSVFISQGNVLLATAAWRLDSPFVSEFRLPASTYEVQAGGAFDAVVQMEPSGEVVLDVILKVAADGSYEPAIAVIEEPFKEWGFKEFGVGLPAPYRAVIELEAVDDELVIKLEPSHPLAGLEELAAPEQVEVLAELKAGLERGEFRDPEPTTLRVKDTERPPIRPPKDKDEGDARPK